MTKRSTSLLAGLCFFVSVNIAGCSNSFTVHSASNFPVPGLYKVISRDCSYPPNAPEDCSNTQYLELSDQHGGLNSRVTHFTTWLSTNQEKEHTFNRRDIQHGRLADNDKFIIENNALSTEWFLLKNGEVSDYFFIRHSRKLPVLNMEGKTHLILQRVVRTEKIDALLRYPITDD